MEVGFTHSLASDTYPADVSPELTARQALIALHSPETGPFLSPLQPGEHERLILRRTGAVIQPGTNMSNAGVADGDVLDVVRTGQSAGSQHLLETDLNWVGLFIVKGVKGGYRSSSSQKECYLEEVKGCIYQYIKDSYKYRRIHNILQFIILSGSAIIPVLIAVPQTPQWTPAIVGGIVTCTAPTRLDTNSVVVSECQTDGSAAVASIGFRTQWAVPPNQLLERYERFVQHMCEQESFRC